MYTIFNVTNAKQYDSKFLDRKKQKKYGMVTVSKLPNEIQEIGRRKLRKP